ncbi:hypothetical protein [Sphingobium fuliginis]|uniref:hypothetical protein n=1 Tax=Sphingobium fuliginis (strain ATCC 27551) TaxID=336203 RepID=UPI0004273373|nr:hypothetical protein [Sphingobium fuliginis]
MTAAATPFSELMTKAHRDIKTSFPMIADEDRSITDLWATIMALSDCRFEIICHDNDVAGRLVCEPAATEFPMAIQLIDHYSEVISRPLQAANARLTLFLDRWVNSNGFLIIITRLIERGASHQSINDMAQRLAVAINDLEEQLRTLAIRHFNAVTPGSRFPISIRLRWSQFCRILGIGA